MYTAIYEPSAQNRDTKALNSLLRGEISAVEAYELALSRFEGLPQIEQLLQIREEHQRAVDFLRERIIRFGGEPAESSSLWGTFTVAVTGVAKLFGPGTALSVLRRGEEYGIDVYEKALTDDHISPDCRTTIASRLLPGLRAHIARLDRLNASMV